jgi:hypothetical protein
VLATNPPTLRPTREALEAEAADQNRPIELCTTLVEGAFQALMDGDARQHDRLVCEAIVRISADVDLVVLAQASMARALDGLPEAERPIPVLTSPHTALERVRKILEGKRR